MKNTKFFVSTLIAAAAMTATAFATDVTDLDETVYTVNGGNTVYISGTISGTGRNEGLRHTGSGGATINIGSDTTPGTLVAGRIELGDINTRVDSILNVLSGSTLIVTGSTNDFVEPGSYKTASVVLGEWGTNTTANISGNFFAKDAIVYPGDSGMDLNISGGVFAVKGIGSGINGSSPRSLTLSDNGKIILGDSGLTNTRGTWSSSLGAGTIGLSAEATTISALLTVTDTTTGTTFDTTQYAFSGEGAEQTIVQGATGGTITLAGGIKGNGLVKVVGAGKLVLNAAETALNNVVVGAGTTLSIDGGALNLSGTATFEDGAKLAFTNMTSSSFALEEAQKNSSGLYENVSYIYMITTGSGTLDGLEASNLTVNGAEIVSLSGSTAKAAGSLSVYNIAVGDEKTLTEVNNAGSWSAINVLGTLDMGSGGGSIGTSESPLALAGDGVVKYSHSDTSGWGGGTGSGIYVADSFVGMVDWAGNLNWASGGVVNLKLGGATLKLSARENTADSMWGNRALDISNKVVFGTDYGINLAGGALTLSGEVDAKGHELKVFGSNNSLTLSGSAELGSLNLESGASIIVSGSLDVSGGTIAGAISGAGTLTFSGGETTWSGTGSLNDGANVTIEDGAVLDASYENARIFQSNFVNGGSLKVQGTLKVWNYNYGGTLGGFKTNPNMVTLDGGTLVFTNSFGSADDADGQSRATTVTSNGGKIVVEDGVSVVLTGNGNAGAFVTNGGSLTFDIGTNGSLLISAGQNTQKKISGSARVEKIGEGVLTLSDASSYTGGTMISAGTLVAANANALGDAGGAVTISGGQLSVSQNVTLAQTAITIVLSNAYNTENSEKIAAISGAGAFADGTTITLDKAADAVALSLVAEAPQKYSYQIFDPTSSLVGTDWTFELGSAWDGWAQSYDTTSGVLTLTIPEPSAFGLLAGVGALALCVSRRRRVKKA